MAAIIKNLGYKENNRRKSALSYLMKNLAVYNDEKFILDIADLMIDILWENPKTQITLVKENVIIIYKKFPFIYDTAVTKLLLIIDDENISARRKMHCMEVLLAIGYTDNKEKMTDIILTEIEKVNSFDTQRAFSLLSEIDKLKKVNTNER